MLRKYFSYTKIWIKHGLVFYYDRIIEFFLDFIIPVLVLSFLWYKAGFIESYEYFLLVYLAGMLSCARLPARFEILLRTGEFTKILNEPSDLCLRAYFSLLGGKILHIPMLFFIFFFLFLKNAKGTLLILPFLPFIFTLSFFYYFFLSFVVFYTESSWGVRWVTRMITSLLGGRVLPFPILEKFLPILRYLPFRLLYSSIFNIYTGKEDFLSLVFLYSFWIFFFFILAKIVWNNCLRKYRAYGG